MKRKNFYILSLVFCFVTASAFSGFFKTGAQIVSSKPPVTPLKTATPPKIVSPTAEPTPEEDNTPITIDTEVVNLNVRVVDRNNRPVNTLTANDFKVYEDNVLQPIDSFTKSEVPTNYSLVIDNSGSLRLQLDKVIEASKIIVGTNRPDDETSVIRFVSSDKIEITQSFTSNKEDLNYALDQLFVEGGQTAIIDAVYLAAQQVNEYEKSSGSKDDKKRRALILVSDGEDRDSFYNEQQLFELLRESDVQIYTIGFVSELSKEGGFISKSPQTKAKAFLERLAQETGGKSYFPTTLSELNGIASDIASELRTQYLVSYYPTNDKKDGAFHAIKVVVNDGPDKQKRIAVTRTGRKAGENSPSNQPVTKPVKKQ
ncbi:MAG TPA: VWA domain-containing protein [Pyrinomonadaceae bacterium]|jgi:Ca-activated chloride channel family protein